ncbi:unnamed protein product [Peronospora belbahrii]|uniref:VWFA domain-containing protein n=1 Tax=Peronospora belbahrii TaxID=622444 RepID=A0AAU9KZH5_9STRA|nr:unnamed protein product [Peronospora belbahrii]CAH0515821.1 unnamed protein product [Peronospora belbahrii]
MATNDAMESRLTRKDTKALYRLMKLVRETQCEVEIVKPLLNELEVLRLCRSFGMMSSVNPDEFDFDGLHASAFDEDFARFLRCEVFENKCAGNVQVKGLVGKQNQVIRTLIEMKVCPDEMIVSLATAREGLYCVKCEAATCTDVQQGHNDKDGATLVVFSWIRNELFEPQALRETLALVLRFLTVLTPDIICCASELDLEQLRAALIDSEQQEEENLASFSVSFSVERQDDAHDGTVCVARSSVDLEECMKECLSVQLLKGSYSALLLTKKSEPIIRTEPFQRTFSASAQLSFAAWLKTESQQHRIELSGTIARSPTLCESILREFEMWPEEQAKASRAAFNKEKQEKYELVSRQLENDIAKQRAAVRKIASSLFQVGSNGSSDVAITVSKQEADTEYNVFRKWVQAKGSWKLDCKSKLKLDIPARLRDIERPLFELYLQNHEVDLAALLSMCATSTKAHLLQAVAKRQPLHGTKIVSSVDAWNSYRDKVADSLSKLQRQWWLAVESSFAAVKTAELANLTRDQKQSTHDLNAATKHATQIELERLRKTLQSNSGLCLTLCATMRKEVVCCNGTKELQTLVSEFQEVVKLEVDERALNSVGLERLGHHFLDPEETQVMMFTVKTRSAVQVCTSRERMCINFIHFPPVDDGHQSSSPGSKKELRAFGKIASVCDYNCHSRTMTFLSEDSVGLYKFDEAFKRMDLIKVIDLGVRSTLTALPFTDAVLLKSTVYVTDSSGCFQGIDIHTDEVSSATSMLNNAGQNAQVSRLMPFADQLAAGVVSVRPHDGGSYEGKLECVCLDDFHRLPVLPLGIEFLTDVLHVQRVDKGILVVDTVAQKLYRFLIEVTVHSSSYRLSQFDENGDEDKDTTASETVESSEKCLRKQHWLYTFYHVFEKFPVIGLLNDRPRRPVPVSILVTCPVSESIDISLENCHDFFSLLMSDLMALNKPLYGLDLTKKLGVRHASSVGATMESMSLRTFFLALITFLPIQICRAESNALALLRDGMNQPLDALELETEENSWGTADIAESIRFGLLSPLLCAWQGHCVVITSMGKQSTGKSFFLNHLTGSSFAIAGNRCTNGAWMTLCVMSNVLLVVLDFEGLGSFERTDQEDVLLAVLNASLSMFTIFRMEMRIDKEVDGLFKKFQKGINLLKNENHLFQGKLYMSVKDINLDDGSGVLSEFKSKINKMLSATRGQNFLTDMYSGKVSINCSPPLGTVRYYSSLSHARQLVQKVICSQADSPRSFRSGDSFHDCIRLVLAKISTLDWTTADRTSQQLQMKNLLRKAPGVIRTGCLLPVDFQTKEDVPKCLMQPIVYTESDKVLFQFETLVQDCPECKQCWPDADQEVAFDNVEDSSVDFGPCVCAKGIDGCESVHSIFVELFQRYLSLSSKGTFELITEDDYVHFDVMLCFLVRRRKVKVALWVKDYLGPDRFVDEWDDFERLHLTPFEEMFKRCAQQCVKCQLQCMRSACHSFGEDHDCGLSHVCRGLCEFCMQSYNQQDEMPRCVGKAGHEGKCNCGKGDHTCGNLCDLSNASNCELVCELKAGHDGKHWCSVKNHICGMSCSATNCGGKCFLGAKHVHMVHKCAATQCSHECEMEGCQERCSTANHFHDNPALDIAFARENGRWISSFTGRDADSMRHVCNSSHACNQVCEEYGICNKSVRVMRSKFSGSFDSFDYDSKQMVSVRNKCAIVLKPGQTDHKNVLHSCAKQTRNGMVDSHGCVAKCEACEYYCEKPVGHRGMHSTAHGNMRKMHFVAKEENKIDWDKRLYAPGEEGVAEMCNLYCSTAGRGHVHYLKCSSEYAGECVYSGMLDHRRHCDSSLLFPRPNHEVDEVLHAEYWKTIGWEDPCNSVVERALFAKCPYLCNAFEHKGRGNSQSGCLLPAWHPPATPQPYLVRNDVTYISGHQFACSHAASKGVLHHIFVLDCSGSMKGGPWQALNKGVREYLTGRLARGFNQDVVSVVTFGDAGKTEFERVTIKNAATRYLNFRGGGTYYAKGLKEASALISRTSNTVYQPVLLFFTDGRPADRKQGLKLARDIQSRYTVFGLRVFVVGYGRASELGLEDLANHLGGEVHEASSFDMLTETFRSISTSLGARAGLICSSNV